MKLIVCGGGTGGHIYPALAIADYFKSKDENTEVLYIGGKNGIENKIVPNYGYRFETIDIKGFQRKISFENMKRAFKSLLTMAKMRGIIKREKPDLVIGTGGYVCGPVVYMASLMKVKTAILEQNVFMGMTNKILAKNADFIFYGFEDSLKRYDYKNAKVSGNPIRMKDFSMPKDEAREKLNFGKDERMILSVGGSGGFENLNNAIFELAKYCREKAFRLIHVSGEYFFEQVKTATKDLDYDKFELFPYIKDIAPYVCASDLVICSAGAGTISELTFAGKPMIVLPKAYTAENHQEYNAKMIQDNKAGFYIKEDELNSEILIEKIEEVFEKEDISLMSKNSKDLYKQNSCEVIYNTIMSK